MTKTRQDKDVIDCIGLVYTEKYIELSKPIRPSMVYDETRQDNDVTNLPCVVYAENKLELLWPIESGVVYHEN